MGAPAGRMRRPHISELIRSVSCQSGPDSSTTTFLPALASTDANTEPDAPAPMMTTSTFSFAMSPPPRRRDVSLVRDIEGGIALHGPVHDVDRIAAQDGVDEIRARSGPALDLVLEHAPHEIALVDRGQCRKLATAQLLAAAIDRADGGAIEIGERRTHVKDTRLQQRLLG